MTAPVGGPGERAAALSALAIEASACTACRLHESRRTVVFGSGDPDADLMIVGEGPGQREDEQGLPFVGRSGELLDGLLAEIGLERSNGVYIANVVKCRPPGNRDPRPDEIESCKGYLRTQLRMVDPKVVLTLGNFASKLLLRTEVGITRLRGHAYPWWGRQLVPTFHPAAALRGNPRVLADMRNDLTLVRAVIDGNLSPSADGGDAASSPPPATDPEADRNPRSQPDQQADRLQGPPTEPQGPPTNPQGPPAESKVEQLDLFR